MAALPQCELNIEVAQLLGSWVPDGAKYAGTWTVSAAGVMALSVSFFKLLVTDDQNTSLANLSL